MSLFNRDSAQRQALVRAYVVFNHSHPAASAHLAPYVLGLKRIEANRELEYCIASPLWFPAWFFLRSHPIGRRPTPLGIPVWTGDIFAYRLLFSQPFFAYVLLKLVSGCGFWRGFTSSEGWE